MVDIEMAPRAQTNDNVDLHWDERLRQAFRRTRGSPDLKFLYLIVDSRADAGMDQDLAKLRGLRYASLWHGSALESFTDIAPYIIAINEAMLESADGNEYRLLSRLLGEQANAHMLTWVWAPFEIEALSEHFKRFCTYTLPDNRAYYLHFYDNRVLQRLRQIWSSDEQQRFIAPVGEIGYQDRRLGEVEWRNERAAAAVTEQTSQSLTEYQHRLLLDLGYADKLALQLRNTCGARISHYSDDELYLLVESQLQNAYGYGIAGEEALSSYVTAGVLISPDFDKHPVVRDRLRAFSQNETASADVLANIDDAIWDDIRDEYING